jgi:hypothetical protein
MIGFAAERLMALETETLCGAAPGERNAGRNAIERTFGRMKDFRRIATRYDKLAANFVAAVHLTAAICYWS